MKVVTELIQEDCSTKKITEELNVIVEGVGRVEMLQKYAELAGKMGTAGASERTAKLITDIYMPK